MRLWLKTSYITVYWWHFYEFTVSQAHQISAFGIIWLETSVRMLQSSEGDFPGDEDFKKTAAEDHGRGHHWGLMFGTFSSSQMQIAIQHFLLQQTKVSSKKYRPIKIRNSGVGTVTSRILQPHQWNTTPGSGGSLPQMKVWRVEAGPATSVFWGPAAFVKLIPRLGIGQNGTNLVHQPTSLVVHVAFQLLLIHFINPGISG